MPTELRTLADMVATATDMAMDEEAMQLCGVRIWDREWRPTPEKLTQLGLA